ncbi:MAG: DNA-protecting protein DprA [Candidatus Eisenbacteria bacterium]|nr:DNA-protecting protein DprA [Candidatus Eisenbacteria bacterium]
MTSFVSSSTSWSASGPAAAGRPRTCDPSAWGSPAGDPRTSPEDQHVTEREAALVVVLASGVGPASAERLRRRYGSYRTAVLTGSRDAAVPARLRRALAAAKKLEPSRRLLELSAEGIDFLERGGEAYPSRLDETYGAPAGLFSEGAPPGEEPAVAIVGSRRASERSLAVARSMGRGLAGRGITVVSGLARGVDSAAHRGALSAGGRTVAVLGSGLRRVYPPEHAGLAAEIRRTGCLLSEFAPRVDPRRSFFPRRNRVIAGLSVGVIVVEASEKSGALITAAFALDEGREVFACPGPAGRAACRGSNRLLRDGARLVEDAEDVLEDLEPVWGPLLAPGGAGEPAPAPEVSACAEAALGALSLDPRSADEVARETGAAIETTLSALMELELAGAARRVPGGRYVVSDAEAVRRGLVRQ